MDGSPTATERFAKSLREIRQARGLSAQKLADIEGFPLARGKIARLENVAGTPIRLDEAVAVANVLGVSLDHMLDGTAVYRDRMPDLARELIAKLDAITEKETTR